MDRRIVQRGQGDLLIALQRGDFLLLPLDVGRIARIVDHLGKQGGVGCDPVAGGDVCELDAGAMTRLLDRIEAKGLCGRERSSQDRRVVKLHLTDEGRAAAREIPVVLARIQNACLAGFTHNEWETLKDYLRRVLDNAQALAANGESNEK